MTGSGVGRYLSVGAQNNISKTHFYRKIFYKQILKVGAHAPQPLPYSSTYETGRGKFGMKPGLMGQQARNKIYLLFL